MSTDIAQRARVVAAMQGKSRSRFLCDILTDYLKQLDAKNQTDPAPLAVPAETKPNEGGSDATH